MSLFRRKKKPDIEFDEILLDSSNLPSFNRQRLEGRLELPLTGRSAVGVAGAFVIIAVIFLGQLVKLQVIEGASYSERSENNRVDKALIIAERGVVHDRNGELLAWNEYNSEDESEFPQRAYTDRKGLGQLIGYVSYPKKDSAGFYFRTEYLGRSGVEEAYNELLAGKNGEQLIEINAVGEVIAENVVYEPKSGKSVTLSIDAHLSEGMYNIIASTSAEANFRSGAAAMIDVQTGEIIAMTSFPSFDPEVLADGQDREAIDALNNDEKFPFLNKIIGGAYTPGSIIKPILAYGALVEHTIDPNKIITSYGQIIVPNPYDPGKPSIFTDWRAHGPMDMRKGIAFSSNVYFYYVGGGFEDQPGLGIIKIDEYMRKFGLGSKTGIILLGEQEGTVPNPEWKQEVFDDDWRLGDTYLTSIGQFGFQVTPIQMLRVVTAIANGGKLFVPHLEKDQVGAWEDLELDPGFLEIIRDGMHMAVNIDGGTVRSLDFKPVDFVGKSGTAELGANKEFVNSWVMGYFPPEDPKYAFVLLMEHGPRTNTIGAGTTMGRVIDWMLENTPQYFDLNVEE